MAAGILPEANSKAVHLSVPCEGFWESSDRDSVIGSVEWTLGDEGNEGSCLLDAEIVLSRSRRSIACSTQCYRRAPLWLLESEDRGEVDDGDSTKVLMEVVPCDTTEDEKQFIVQFPNITVVKKAPRLAGCHLHDPYSVFPFVTAGGVHGKWKPYVFPTSMLCKNPSARNVPSKILVDSLSPDSTEEADPLNALVRSLVIHVSPVKSLSTLAQVDVPPSAFAFPRLDQCFPLIFYRYHEIRSVHTEHNTVRFLCDFSSSVIAGGHQKNWRCPTISGFYLCHKSRCLAFVDPHNDTSVDENLGSSGSEDLELPEGWG
ncbi:hypothetical protein H920_14954 [Fukomys damarensis]|uniref:Uncharacterized protein n=1 Tax=Fukomys damarensis TaxID=885580 RepID=A0A091D0S5_FUKDA|nr:hypothetical protein H920_14954 [Fukomys damarensis]